MMNKKRILLPLATAIMLAMGVLNVTDARAQLRKPVPRDMTMARIRAAAQVARAQLDTLTLRMQTWRYTGDDTLSNPYYFPIFSPATLYDGVLDGAFALPAPEAGDPWGSENRLRAQAVGEALRYIYTRHPWSVSGMPIPEDASHPIEEKDLKEVKAEVKLTEKAQKAEPKVSITTPTDWNIDVRRPNFWTFKTSTSFQFTQNYISSNWHKGGESNNALLASVNFEANYNNKTKITLNNLIETKIGFQSSRSDEKRKYKTNADLLRMTNKLGFKATNHWYYTFMLQSWTQFTRGYRSNDDHVYSDFMSPFEGLFSVGMDYRLSKSKFSLNATISPFACNFKYVDRKYLAPSFGINENKHSKFTFGSNITANYNWNIAKNIQWSGRIYYFTDYKKVQVEWENTFNLTINKFLSSRLFLYPRFDDSVNRKEGDSYIQFNELLSVGLNVTF